MAGWLAKLVRHDGSSYYHYPDSAWIRDGYASQKMGRDDDNHQPSHSRRLRH